MDEKVLWDKAKKKKKKKKKTKEVRKRSHTTHSNSVHSDTTRVLKSRRQHADARTTKASSQTYKDRAYKQMCTIATSC